MCETRDLGIKRPQLLFGGQVAVGMRVVCLPAGREEDTFEASQDAQLEEMGSKE